MDNKKNLTILGVIIGLIIVGLVVYWIFIPPGTTETGTDALPVGAFPEGTKVAPGKTPTSVIFTNPTPTISAGQQKSMTQLAQTAISGATFISSSGKVRYFEKATGFVYDLDPAGGVPEKISNTTIPGIFEIHWSLDGKQAAVRYIEKNKTGVEDIIRNFGIVSFAASTTKGVFLPSAISALASSPKESKIFYLMPFEGTNLGITASFENKKQSQVFSTAFGEWLVSWPTVNIINLLTKPSAAVSGFLYKLNPVSGALEKILGGIPGLTALASPDGEKILYSQSDLNGFKTNLYSVKEKKPLPFNLITLPEKCVWSKLKKDLLYCAIPYNILGGTYPDDWYKGLISFSDRIWKIDTIKGTTETISVESNLDFDFTGLFLNKTENYLFLRNKNDGTLWGLQI